MKRKVIKIDEEKCTGCGKCIPDCPEGALQIIDGKVRLVSDLFCDGLGACIGSCPYGAITVEEREAAEYDEKKVMGNIIKQGKNVIKAHLKHLRDHRQVRYLEEARQVLRERGIEINIEEHNHSCLASKPMYFKSKGSNSLAESTNSASQLTNWPIELALINSSHPCFREEEIAIAADCTAFSYANFHSRFLKVMSLIILCPKLDKAIDLYIDKLTSIFKNNLIKFVTLVHMEVSCCFGLLKITEDAIRRCGRQVVIKEYTISIQGEII